MVDQPSSLSPEHLQRLAFIRYLHALAEQQAEAPEPRSAVAVLMLHDAVELFLNLVTEKRGVARQDRKFASYFDAVPDLQVRGAMVRLNDARVSLKHSGIRPSHGDVVDLLANTRIFLSENTRIIFGVEFSQVSMVDLVQPIDVRDSLNRAVACLASADRLNTLIEVARAFRQLIEAFSKRSHGARMLDRVSVSAESRFAFLRIQKHIDWHVEGAFEEIMRFLDVIKDAVMAQLLRQDSERYFRFQALASRVRWFGDGSPIVPHKDDLDSLTVADLEFAIDFVTEVALQLGAAEVPAGGTVGRDRRENLGSATSRNVEDFPRNPHARCMG